MACRTEYSGQATISVSVNKIPIQVAVLRTNETNETGASGNTHTCLRLELNN